MTSLSRHVSAGIVCRSTEICQRFACIDISMWKQSLYPFSWYHDDVIKWKHFPRYWPLVRGIHRSPMNSTHKGQSRGTLMFSMIYVWIKVWVNNREAGDLRRYRAHYDVTVMLNYNLNFWRKQLLMLYIMNNASGEFNYDVLMGTHYQFWRYLFQVNGGYDEANWFTCNVTS